MCVPVSVPSTGGGGGTTIQTLTDAVSMEWSTPLHSTFRLLKGGDSGFRSLTTGKAVDLVPRSRDQRASFVLTCWM